MSISAEIAQHGEGLLAPIFFTTMVVLFAIERGAGFRSTNRNGRRWKTNAALTVFALIAMSIMPVSFLTASLWAHSEGFGLLNWLVLPQWVFVLVSLLLRGGISTFTHWLSHKVPWLWRLHRVHHLDTELDVTTTLRFHPLEIPVGVIVGAPLVILFGLPFWVLVLYELLDAGINVSSHSNLRLPRCVDRWLCVILVTPNLHRIHHSSHQPETDSNFGAVFPFWDLVFGTFRTQTVAPPQKMQIGLAELRGQGAQRLKTLLLSPLKADLPQGADKSAPEP